MWKIENMRISVTFFFLVLKVEHRVMNMLGKYSTTELSLQSIIFLNEGVSFFFCMFMCTCMCVCACQSQSWISFLSSAVHLGF